jgi:hypothetical protein
MSLPVATTEMEAWTTAYMEATHRAVFLEGIGAAVDYDTYTQYPKAALEEMYSHRHAVQDGSLNRTILMVARWFADFTLDLLNGLMALDARSRDALIQRFHTFVLPIAAGLRAGTNVSVDDARLVWRTSVDPLDVHLGSGDMGLVTHIRGFRLQTYLALTETTGLWLKNTENLITSVYCLRDTIRHMLQAQPLQIVLRGPDDADDADDASGTAPYDHGAEDWADLLSIIQISPEEQALHDRAAPIQP